MRLDENNSLQIITHINNKYRHQGKMESKKIIAESSHVNDMEE